MNTIHSMPSSSRAYFSIKYSPLIGLPISSRLVLSWSKCCTWTECNTITVNHVRHPPHLHICNSVTFSSDYVSVQTCCIIKVHARERRQQFPTQLNVMMMIMVMVADHREAS